MRALVHKMVPGAGGDLATDVCLLPGTGPFPVVCLTVTSFDLPRILPHPNHMAPLFEGEPLIAHTQILHGREHASHLPVVEGV